MKPNDQKAFTRFVKETEPRLSYALAAAYGLEVGAEATADAMAWAWEHWDDLQNKRNPWVVERDGKLLIQEHYAYSSDLNGNP